MFLLLTKQNTFQLAKGHILNKYKDWFKMQTVCD